MNSVLRALRIKDRNTALHRHHVCTRDKYQLHWLLLGAARPVQNSHQTPTLPRTEAWWFAESSWNSSFSLVAIFSPNEAIRKNHNGLTFLQHKEGYREGDTTSVCTVLKASKTKNPETKTQKNPPKTCGSCNLGTKICIAVTQTLADCHRYRDRTTPYQHMYWFFWHCTTGGIFWDGITSMEVVHKKLK